MFSFRIFIVSGLVFKLNPFLADFFVQYKIAVQFHFFFFLACDYLVYPTLFIEEMIFSPLYFWHLCKKKNNWPYAEVYLWAFCFLSLCVYMVYMTFMSLSCCFDYCSFVIQFKSGGMIPLALFFYFFHDYLGYSESFVGPMQILGLFYFCEKCHWHFERDYIEFIV